MKIYKIKLFDAQTGGENSGYAYRTSKKEANSLADEQDEDSFNVSGHTELIKEFDVSLNKSSIIDFLNKECSHPDNG